MGATDRTALRIALHQAWTKQRPGALSLQAEFSDAFTAAAQVVDGPWGVEDFRPSERERWDALLSAAITQVQREAEAALLDALTEALVVFATEHPEAPRANGGR